MRETETDARVTEVVGDGEGGGSRFGRDRSGNGEIDGDSSSEQWEESE